MPKKRVWWEVGEFLAETCAHLGGGLFAERRLMGSARGGSGLYRILMTRGCRSVSNFYADIAILGTRRAQAPMEIRRGDPARPCSETHAELLVLERGRARATRHER